MELVRERDSEYKRCIVKRVPISRSQFVFHIRIGELCISYTVITIVVVAADVLALHCSHFRFRTVRFFYSIGFPGGAKRRLPLRQTEQKLNEKKRKNGQRIKRHKC